MNEKKNDRDKVSVWRVATLSRVLKVIIISSITALLYCRLMVSDFTSKTGNPVSDHRISFIVFLFLKCFLTLKVLSTLQLQQDQYVVCILNKLRITDDKFVSRAHGQIRHQ